MKSTLKKLRLLGFFLFFAVFTVVLSVGLLNHRAGVNNPTQVWRSIAERQLADVRGWFRDLRRLVELERTGRHPEPPVLVLPESLPDDTTTSLGSDGVQGYCVEARAVKSRETGFTVYSWSDAHGTAHFSNEAPEGQIFEVDRLEVGKAGFRAVINADGIYVSDAVPGGLVYCVSEDRRSR